MGKVLISPSLLSLDLELGLPSCHTEWFSLSLQLSNSINIYENINCVLLLANSSSVFSYISLYNSLGFELLPENRAQGQKSRRSSILKLKHIHFNSLHLVRLRERRNHCLLNQKTWVWFYSSPIYQLFDRAQITFLVWACFLIC